MPRYKNSPEERAAEKERKENLRKIMQGLDVKNFDDLKDVFKLMVGEMLENGLEGELDDELGYTKYDYRNKHGNNSRNGYSQKTLKTSFGETEIRVPPVILSIIVGTFSSNIHTLMRSYLRNYSIAASLPWEEARHWKYISACCSNS